MTCRSAIREPDFVISGQAYWLDRTEPYRRLDGQMTQLDVFMTHCAQCGERFEVKRPAGGTSALNRRCAKHRRPGIKVDRQR